MTKPAASSDLRKRVMDVEDVISWAYREELPKRSKDRVSEPCQVSPMFRLGQYGVRIDNWHREPGFPAIMGDPHPDAFLVEAAVESLARFSEMPIDDGLDLAPDLAAFGLDEHAAMRRALRQVVPTVVGVAKLRKRPFWHDRTYPMPVHTDDGRPRVYRWATMTDGTVAGGEVEYECLVPVDGGGRSGVYPSGSHSPLRFDPDPQGILGERAEWAAWWAALNMVAEDLSGRMASIAVLPPAAPQRPWIDREEAPKPVRIFADLSAPIYRSLARQTYEAHRALGARRHISARSKEARRSAPRRTMLPVALRA